MPCLQRFLTFLVAVFCINWLGIAINDTYSYCPAPRRTSPSVPSAFGPSHSLSPTTAILCPKKLLKSQKKIQTLMSHAWSACTQGHTMHSAHPSTHATHASLYP